MADKRFHGKTDKKRDKKRILRDKGGVTLVELVVAFALLGLFLALSCQVIASCMRVYYQVKGTSYGRQVTETLMDKITGEIEGAQVSISRGTGESEDKTLKIYGDGRVIELYDRTGSHICVTTAHAKDKIRDPENGDLSAEVYQGDGDQLLFYYYAVLSSTSGAGGSQTKVTRYEAVDWTFDKASYMGYQVEKLRFSQADPTGAVYPKNVIKVELKIKSGRYGSYKATRYVECYNFSEPADFDKIADEGGSGGGTDPVEPDTEPTEPSTENPTEPPTEPSGGLEPGGPSDMDFTDGTEDMDPLVKALDEYFSSGWNETQIVDKNGTAGTVYYKVTENNGRKYITVYRCGLDIDKGDLKDFAEAVTDDKNNRLIDINNEVLSNNSDSKNLLEALGGNYSEEYKQINLHFDTERKKLMGVKYNYHDGQGQKNHWGYYGDYNEEDIPE